MTGRGGAFAWRLRGHLYRRIRESGVVPDRAELGEGLRAGAGDVDRALEFLADAHILVLDEAGEIRMAHPFSAVGELSRGWYAGRLSDHWRPSSAKAKQALLRESGLEGAFWQLHPS